MSRSRILQLVFLLAAAGAVVLGASLQGSINAARVAMGVTPRLDVAADLPPQLRILQAVPGWFRAIPLQLMWIRSQGHKQQGKSYDAEQLATWICELEWRFPAPGGSTAGTCPTTSR